MEQRTYDRERSTHVRHTGQVGEHSRLEVVEDVVKSALQWIAVTALAFGYWMFMLLLISIFTLNVWHVAFEEILRYAIVLTVITSIVYLVVIIRRKIK